MRRLLVLIRGLPPTAGIWVEAARAAEAALKSPADLIRERQKHYEKGADS